VQTQLSKHRHFFAERVAKHLAVPHTQRKMPLKAPERPGTKPPAKTGGRTAVLGNTGPPLLAGRSAQCKRGRCRVGVSLPTISTANNPGARGAFCVDCSETPRCPDFSW
jgi:hypothetical protein